MWDRTAGVWSHFTAEGLPDASIECLYQDRHDRMWIGTSDHGVACFDQKTVATFTHQDGLSGNGVHSIVEDVAGQMWLGTNRGLTWYDDEGFHPLAASLSHSFLCGGADDEGGVWFGLEQQLHSSPALAHWDGQQLRLIALTDRAPLHGESIYALAIDTQGTIWCGGRSLYSYDRMSDTPHRHARFNEIAPNAEVTGLLARSDGTLWLATTVGVFVFDGREFRLLEPSRQSHFLAIAEDPRSETIYLPSYEGALACCDGEQMDFAYRGDLSFSRGLCVDRLGRLWVGTRDRGLHCYDSQRLQVFGSDQGLPATSSIAQSDAGPLWTSTEGGLVRFDTQRSSVERIAVPGCEKITALCLDRDNRVWFGGTGTGLYRYDCDSQQMDLMHQPASPDSISALAMDASGRVWFAYQRIGGLGCVEDGQVRWFGSATPTQIDALAWSRQGHLWLGSNSADEGHGLYRFDGTTCAKVDAPACLIFALYEGADGRLWIGTNRGLLCLNEGRIRHFTQADGLPCATVTSVLQAGDGRLWMGTEGRGLCGYDGQVFQHVEVPEPRWCNTVRDLAEGRDGALYLATKGGVVRYAPRHISPQAVVVSVEADAAYEVAADQEAIRFPSTADSVRIRFAGTSPLDPPAHLIYRYRLDGLTSAWRQTAETQVEYPPLPPGTYAFCLQAVDRDLTYSEQVRVHFEVTDDARMAVLQRWFVGQSDVMRQVEADFLEAAETDLTVLLLGETGTGKSLAAQAIHELSARRDAPFVTVNCGTLGRELVNNELFGHERGAYTGAHDRHIGKFERANQGTLFLDEIGDLALDVQANLLEVLQEQRLYRVGGNQAIPVDVRVIAATHDNLEQAIVNQTFRADLFYRLEGYALRIPPLRERPEDIPLLADHFATQLAAQLNQPVAPISPAGIEVLQAYDWPGNVRQLEHAVQRAVIAARRGPLEPDHFAQGIGATRPYQRESAFAIVPLADHLRQYLTRVLNHTNGVISGPRGAANLLGLHPNTLRSRLRKLGIPFRKKERADNPD